MPTWVHNDLRRGKHLSENKRKVTEREPPDCHHHSAPNDRVTERRKRSSKSLRSAQNLDRLFLKSNGLALQPKLSDRGVPPTPRRGLPQYPCCHCVGSEGLWGVWIQHRRSPGLQRTWGDMVNYTLQWRSARSILWVLFVPLPLEVQESRAWRMEWLHCGMWSLEEWGLVGSERSLGCRLWKGILHSWVSSPERCLWKGMLHS